LPSLRTLHFVGETREKSLKKDEEIKVAADELVKILF
jgi:hypothetical protein